MLRVACWDADQEAATPATGEHYAFAEEMFRKVWDMYRVPEYGLFSEYYPNSYRPDVNYFDDGAKSTRRFPSCGPWTGCSPRQSRWPKSIR